MQTSPQHIHFLGIAGIGVSALAQLAQARGIQVSGSDPNADPAHNPAVARLAAGGAKLFTTHQAENLAEDVDLVVATAAVSDANPEIKAARERNIPVVSRAEFLGQLMAAHKGPKIAVAGTHGKTTTTGMIGVMLQHAGLDPTVFVGGEVPELGGNVRIGSPDGPFVAEACEAYDSFLYLKPDIAVITNIEADHLDHYGTEERVIESFHRFTKNVPEDGNILVCTDDPLLRQWHESDLSTLSYGTTGEEFSSASNIVLSSQSTFVLVDYDPALNESIQLQVPGMHNVRNALAAAGVGLLLHMNVEHIAAGLAEFRGATRRQDVLGEGKLNAEDAETVLVMDDYAHHPTEIRATLDALRSAYPNRRLVAIFQPHLYSRTRDFLEGFADALSQADILLVTDIYAAREQPKAGVHAADIVTKAIAYNTNLPATFLPDKQDIPATLHDLARPGDVCVFLGAGDIRDQGERFLALLHSVSETDSPMPTLSSNSAASAATLPAVRKRRIAVLMGGTSSEREISLNTGRQIVSALDPTKFDVIAIDTRDLLQLQSDNPVGAQFIAPAPNQLTPAPDVENQGVKADVEVINHVPTNQVSEQGIIQNPHSTIHNVTRPDLVFIALHGRGGEDGAVQGMLEVLGIPYTGSGILASALAMDKAMCKRLFRSANIPVASEILLSERPSEMNALIAQIQDRLNGFPVFVKPNREGSTVGGTLVKNAEQLAEAVNRAFQYDNSILIEPYLRGMEITVGILGNAGEELTPLPVVEIVPKSDHYDFESKYATGGSEHIIPARLDEAQTRQVQELARQCHTLLGCRGMSRTDFIVTSDGPFALEVNTIPGMTPTSLLPQAAASAGIAFAELLERIIDSAEDRRQKTEDRRDA